MEIAFFSFVMNAKAE